MTFTPERLGPALLEDVLNPTDYRIEPQTDVPSGLVLLNSTNARTANRRWWLLQRGPTRLIGVALLVAIWELASAFGWLSPQELAGPSVVVRTGAHMLANGTLETALWASLQRVFWGLAIGVPLGAALALVSGLSRLGENLIDGNVQMLRFVPIIGLESLFVLWLGVGETAKVSLIVMGVMFPIYINTYAAIQAIDPRFDELSEVVGLSSWAHIRRVVLPAALPGFLVGLRMAMAVAWLILVFAEQINASSGLGFLIIQAQAYFQSNVIVVCLACYAILGLLTDTFVRGLERVMLRWQPGR